MPPFVKSIEDIINVDMQRNTEHLNDALDELRCVREAGDKAAIRATLKTIRCLKRQRQWQNTQNNAPTQN